MKRLSPILLKIVLLILAIFSIQASATVYPTEASTYTPTPSRDVLPPDVFDFTIATVPAGIQHAVITEVSEHLSDIFPGGTYFVVGTFHYDKTWGYGTIGAARGNIPPDWSASVDFIVHKEKNGQWIAALLGTEKYEELAERIPDFSLRTPTYPASNDFKFMWDRSQVWCYTSSWHNGTSVDFAPRSDVPSESRWLLSSSDGYLHSTCNDGYQAFVKVDNSSLGDMGYGHLDSATITGSILNTNIPQGQRIAKAYDGTEGEGWYDIGQPWPWPSCNPPNPPNCDWDSRTGCCYLQYMTTCGAGTGAHYHWTLPGYNTTVEGWTIGSDGYWRKPNEDPRGVGSCFTSTNGDDTTPPTKASNVRPDGWDGPYTNDTTPRFQWDPASDGESGMAGYYVAVDDWTPEGKFEYDWWVGNVTSFNVPDSIPDGEHIFAVTAMDNAGNRNPTNTNNPGDAPYYTFYVDTVRPTLSFNVPATNQWYNTDQILSWDISDGTSGAAYSKWSWDDDSPNNQVSGSHGSVHLSSAGQGQHTLYVQAWDRATNHTNPEPRGWFGYDTQPPSNPTSVDSGCAAPNNVWQNDCNDPDFTWSGASDGNGIGVQDYHYYWGDDPSGTPDTYTSAAGFDPPAASGDVAVRYLRVATRDQLNQESSPATLFVLRYDAAPPTVTVTINDGAETANQVDVRLTLSAADEGSGVEEMCVSNNALCDDWRPYEEESIWTLPALDRRTLGVYVRVRDKAGNESALAADTIYLDLYPPMPHSDNFRLCADVLDSGGSAITSTSYSLVSAIGQTWATGDERLSSGFLAGITGCLPITRPWTSNYTVTQWVIASGGNLRGSTSYRLGDTTGQPAASGGHVFSSTHYTLASGFWAQITGTVPTTSTPPTEPPTPTPGPTPTPAPTPTPIPSGFGVSIEDGALYTNDPLVEVRLWAPNVTEMRLSNDGGYSDTGWETYRVTTTWTLATYGDYVMPRYVYAWFRDDAGVVYGAYFDDIIYDPVPPRGQVRIVLPDTLRPQEATEAVTVTLLLDGYDDNSGVSDIRVWEAGQEMTAAEWQPFTDTLQWAWQGGVVYAQFRDNAGNASSVYGSDGSEYAVSQAVEEVTLTGPAGGFTGEVYTFTAQVQPVTATQPVTYIWTATGHPTVTHAARMSATDAMTYTWEAAGPQTVTVTAANGLGEAVATHGILISELTAEVEKSVWPEGMVHYGDELTYTLLISGAAGARVGLYDPLDEGVTFGRFVVQPAGVVYAGGVITGTVALTPTAPVTVAFVVQVGVPGTLGWTVDVSNRACVYTPGEAERICRWSNEVINQAYRPFTVYLPVILRE